MSDQQVILFFGNDLMFFSKISSAASQAGYRSAMAKSVESLEAKFKPEQIAWVIVDLFQMPSEHIDELVSSLRAFCSTARVIGFGPHVDGDVLRAARDAGLDVVMTRGQLHRSLPDMFMVAN